MPKAPFQPCIPTRGTKVPTGQDWLHEVKYGGYRLIVQREGKRDRLFPATAMTGAADIRSSPKQR
jgi:bifunctional non-homologous end joining protein LigD